MPTQGNYYIPPIDYFTLKGSKWQITGFNIEASNPHTLFIDHSTGLSHELFSGAVTNGYYTTGATGIYSASGQYDSQPLNISWQVVNPATNLEVSDYNALLSSNYLRGFEINFYDETGKFYSGVNFQQDGSINKVDFLAGGSGYVNPSVVITGAKVNGDYTAPSGTGAFIRVHTMGSGLADSGIHGSSVEFSLPESGSGYLSGIIDIQIVSGGSGYTDDTVLLVTGTADPLQANKGVGSGAHIRINEFGLGKRNGYFGSNSFSIDKSFNTQIFGGSEFKRKYQIEVVGIDYYGNRSTGRLMVDAPKPKIQDVTLIKNSDELSFKVNPTSKTFRNQRFEDISLQGISVFRGTDENFEVKNVSSSNFLKNYIINDAENKLSNLGQITIGPEFFSEDDVFQNYYYKFVPFDVFGTGDIISYSTGIRVSNSVLAPDIPSGLKLITDPSKTVGTNIEGETITNTYLTWKKDRLFETKSYEVVLDNEVEKESSVFTVAPPSISGIDYMVTGTGSNMGLKNSASLGLGSRLDNQRTIFDIFSPYGDGGIQWIEHTIFIDSNYLSSINPTSVVPKSVAIPAGNTTSGFIYFTGADVYSTTYVADDILLPDSDGALVAKNINNQIVTEYEPKIQIPLTKQGGQYSVKIRGYNDSTVASNYSTKKVFTASGNASHFNFTPGQAELRLGGTGTITKSGPFVTTVGGSGITAVGTGVVVVGGVNNRVTGELSALVGGSGNRILGAVGKPGEASFLGGGRENYISGNRNVLVGGDGNLVSGDGQTLVGGYKNTIFGSDIDATSGSLQVGETENDLDIPEAIFENSIIGGGQFNVMSGSTSFIGGGYKNTIGIDVTRGTTVYGEDIDSQDWVKKANRALNSSAIVGGRENQIFGNYNFIGGGYGNQIFEGGNQQQGAYSVIAGGQDNTITGTTTARSIILGGKSNINAGVNSIVGGIESTGQGNQSLALGSYGWAAHNGAFVLADSSRPDKVAGHYGHKKSLSTNSLNLFFNNGTYVRNGALYVSGDATVSGNLNVSGSFTLGDTTTDTLTAIGEITTSDYVSGLSGYFGKIGIGTTTLPELDGTRLMVANGNAGFGNTEVMTITGPIHPIHVSDASNASILIDSYSDTVGTSAKLYFRTEAEDSDYRTKGGIFFERLAGTYGNGMMRFAVDSAGDNNNVGIDDSKMVIDRYGNVLIGEGVGGQGAKLTVSGNASITGELRVAGEGEFATDLYVGDKIRHIGDSNTFLEFSNDLIYLKAGNVNLLELREVGTDYVAVGGLASSTADVDFYVNTEVAGQDYAFVVDAGLPAVGINIDPNNAKGSALVVSGNASITGELRVGTNTILGAAGSVAPVAPLTVKSSSASSEDCGITLQGSSNSNPLVKIAEKSTDGGRFHMYDGGVEKIAFYTDGTSNHISAGKVGIGTASPDVKLHLYGAGSPQFRIEDSTNNCILKAYAQDSDAFLGTHSNHNLNIGTNNATNITVEAGGNVGIGTSNPGAKLEVYDGDSKFEVDPGNNRIRLRDHAFVSGNLQVSGDLSAVTSGIVADEGGYVSGTSGYFGKVGIGSSTIDAGVILQLTKTDVGDNEVPEVIKLSTLNSASPSWSMTDGLCIGAQMKKANGTTISKQPIKFRYDGGDMATTLEEGKVGIGTNAPTEQLTVFASIAGSPATAGSGANGNFAIESTNGNSLYFGSYNGSPYGCWLQVSNYADQSLTYPLVLQPNGGNVGIGTSGPGGTLHIVSSDLNNNLILESTETGGSTAPDLVLYRNSTSAADNDYIGVVRFRGKNDNASPEDVEYGAITSQIKDSTDGSEDGELALWTMEGGTLTQQVTLDSVGKVGIGTTNPSHLLHLRADNPYIDFTDDGDDGQGGLLFRDTSNNNQGSVIFDFANNVLKFSAHTWSNNAHMALYRSTGPKLQISPDQNVAPQAMLVVSGDASVTGQLKVGEGIGLKNGYSLHWDNENTRIKASHANQHMGFDVGGTSNTIYLKPGKVGINWQPSTPNSMPSATLSVSGDASITGELRTAGKVALGGVAAGRGSFTDVVIGDPTSDNAQVEWYEVNSSAAWSLYDNDRFSIWTNYSSSWQERLSVDLTAGNVGIGTSDPSGRLHVRAGSMGPMTTTIDSRYNLVVEDNGENYIGMYAPTNSYNGIRFNDQLGLDGYIDYYHGTAGDCLVYSAGNHHKFAIGALEEMRLTANGLIINTESHFNTDNHGAMLVVSGDASITGELRTNGSLGVGAPNGGALLDPLHISAGNPRIRLEDTAGTNNYSRILADNGQLILSADEGNDQASSAIIFKVDNGEVMRMNGANVGIGTNNPQELLHIDGASPRIRLRDDDAAGTPLAHIDASDGALKIQADSSNETAGSFLTLEVDGSEYLRATGGYIGIGTTSPAAKLEVNAGNVRVDDDRYVEWGGTNARIGGSNAGDYVFFLTNNEDRMRIISNGNVGIGENAPTGKLHIYQSGDSQPAFLVEGSQGSLFSVEDTLTGSLMSVNDIAGLPVFEAFDDGTIVMGQYNSGDLVVTGNKVGIGTSAPTSSIQVKGNQGTTFEFTDSSNRSLTDLGAGVLSWNAAAVLGSASWGGTADIEIDQVASSTRDILNVGDKFDVSPVKNQIRLRDHAYVSGNLYVSGSIITADGTSPDHISGLSGYFGKVGIGSSSIDALTDGTATRLQISHPDESFAVNLKAAGTSYIPSLALSSDRPSASQEMGKIKWLNNGASPVAQIKAIRGSSDTVGHLNFQTCNAHAMQIWSNQKVQIASTQHVAPQATLVVSGDASVTGQLAAESLRVHDSNGNAANRFKIEYNGTNGNATVGPDSGGGNTNFLLGTSNGGSYSTKVTIKNNGDVGIGTASPDNFVNIRESALAGRSPSNSNTSLTIEHATDCGVQFFSATQTQLRFGDAASTAAGAIIYEHGDDNFKLNFTDHLTVNGSAGQKVRFENDGKVLIGEGNGATALLTVSGDASITGELKTDGNVGINADPVAHSQTAARNLVIKQDSGGGGITISTATNAGGNIYFSDGTIGDQLYRGYLVYNHTIDTMLIGAAGNTHFAVDATATQVTGDLRVAEYIRHGGDENTYIQFGGDTIDIYCGSQNMLSFDEDSTQDEVVVNENSADIDFRCESNNNTHMLLVDAANDLVGIGTSTPSPSYTLTVNGGLAADFKSFIIDHPDPAKPDKQLAYASSETPEHNVFVRGKAQSKIIELPDHWPYLVHEDSISVQLTPIGEHQELYVESIKDNKILINNSKENKINCFYLVHAERKDIGKLEIEPDKSVNKDGENGE